MNCQNAPVINFYGHEVVYEMTIVHVCLPQLFEVHPCISIFYLLWVASGPTVKVKFELHKECHYGQQFNVVGADPQLGDWEPSAALPLNWTEGHVWTTEVVSFDCHSVEIYALDTEIKTPKLN